MQFIKRHLTTELIEMSKCYPVVTIIGPRQSGKTTLVKTLFPNKPYVSLEDLDERDFAKNDPKGFLARYPDGAIFDEIQRLPDLLSYIQTIVDKQNKNGIFILTGSNQQMLHQAVTQSLAGRTAILKLLPFSISEIKDLVSDFSADDFIYNGMHPRTYMNKINPTKYFRDYIQTYIEKDVRQILNIKDLTTFQHFLKLCASRVGQIFNSHAIANELGISHQTVKNWLSVLEASFLIIRLQPYFENFGKRVIKSPKIYFTDVGLAAYLLNIDNVDQVFRDPLRGNLFENLMVIDIYKEFLNRGKEPPLYFYRDSNLKEVDLLCKLGNNLIPIEIKSSQTFSSKFLSGLDYFQKLLGKRCPHGFLIYTGDQEQKVHDFDVLNFKNMNEVQKNL